MRFKEGMMVSFLAGNSAIGSDGKLKPVLRSVKQVRAGTLVLIHHKSARATFVAVLVDADVPFTSNISAAFRIKPVFSKKGLQNSSTNRKYYKSLSVRVQVC